VGTVVGGAAVVGAAVPGVVVGAPVVPVTAERKVVGTTADDGVEEVLGAIVGTESDDVEDIVSTVLAPLPEPTGDSTAASSLPALRVGDDAQALMATAASTAPASAMRRGRQRKITMGRRYPSGVVS
jgi:hypothetical protein